MSAPQKTLATLLSLLLVATLWGLWSTGQEPAKVQGAKAAAADTPANPLPVIDQNTLSASPGIAVRPAVGGVEIAVRYVTRASERFALRARLYQSAVQLLADAPKS